ncbi:MAG: helix-turn-helix transcriptional regulator [Alistipes sp.]|nr:helix-turn-helix transcriptional regulator [Alistipes sp.]MBR6631750.1 helix-turn-helix transcriptional regulator [Alistipes sp.]
MMPQMQMVIIMENSLSAMALRSILVDITPTSVEVVSYSSLAEYLANKGEAQAAHYFVSASTIFHNSDYFRPIMRRTIVFVEGEASTFVQSGFRTVDITSSEQNIVRSLLQIHQAGHPHGNHPATKSERPQLLSARECDVLALVVKGHINKEIADILNISLATVVFHRNNISEKLQTRSIGRQTIYAVLNNIVSLTDI